MIEQMHELSAIEVEDVSGGAFWNGTGFVRITAANVTFEITFTGVAGGGGTGAIRHAPLQN